MKSTKTLLTAFLLFNCKSTPPNQPNSATESITSGANAPLNAYFNIDQSPYKEIYASGKNKRFDVNDVTFLWPASLFDNNFNEVSNQDAAPLFLSDLFNQDKNLQTHVKTFESFLCFEPEGCANGAINQISLINPIMNLKERAAFNTDSITVTENFEITSVRFDDCGPRTAQNTDQTTMVNTFKFDSTKVALSKNVATPCIPQMRLVAEPPLQSDGGIHIIFSYMDDPYSFYNGSAKTDATIQANMMRDLQILKSISTKKTDGLPLGVHPDLVYDLNKPTDFHIQLKKLIKHYAQAKYLTKLAVLGTLDSNGGTDWIFTAGEVHQKNDGTSQLHMIPIFNVNDGLHDSTNNPLKQGHISVGFTSSFSTDKNLTYINQDIPHIHFNYERTKGNKGENLAKILNPMQTDVPQIDCISCHAAPNAIFQIAKKNTSGIAELKKIVASKFYYRPKKGITAFVDPNAITRMGFEGPMPLGEFNFTQQLNFHALGKFNQNAVSLRTVYDSAETAASFNRRLFGTSDGPGLICDENKFVNLTVDIIDKIAKNKAADIKINCN